MTDIASKDHITDILVRSLKKDRVAHVYLFTGPRGVGKASIARMLAHKINNLPYSEGTNHLDIIEIDAASNYHRSNQQSESYLGSRRSRA